MTKLTNTSLSLVALTMLLPVGAAAQGVASSRTVPPVPRTANGKPDLSGVYQPGGTTVGPAWEGAEEPEGAGRRITNRIAPAPMQPWAAQLMRDDFKSRNIDADGARCLPNPKIVVAKAFPVEFVQSDSKFVILMEYMGLFHTIPLSGSLPEDMEPTYMGTSVGHWEGDTLVVDTREFYEQLHYGGIGKIHSDALHLTERFTRTDYNTVKYDAIWDDPKVLTRPDEIHTQFMLRPGLRIREFICGENNQAPANYETLRKTGAHIRK